ncbi:hypothetical protein A6R68_16933 [Neotoma lepida]|uniref:Cilia- and flagella-associated protein 161 n=1 Tax=Neotoma lepida TaxID=56216 RepID=A0A1A6HED0_NEOLE|nr:hypothetical protein A6R68_16933 [Neotoma lepida]
MAQKLYGPGVRMGNWNEDAYLEEERMRDFLEKREKGELLIQKNRSLKKNFLRPIRAELLPRDTSRTGMQDAFMVAMTQIMCCLQLYLSSDHRTLQRSSKKSWLQEVTLTDKVSHLNCWQAVFLYPQLRLEYEGFPVKANEKLVISHRHTNRALAVHRHLFLRTYFGKEVEVAAHTHLDSHRIEKPKNHWMLVTGNPRNKSTTMLDLPKPPAADTRAVEQIMGIAT